MTENEAAVGGAEFKDRKTGLVVFGILQIVLGSLCALIVPFMILGMVAASHIKTDSAAPPMTAGTMIPGLFIYVLLATWFIWMGIGSITARRWARALVLVTSWLWLLCGIGGLVVMLVIMPNMFSKMSQAGQMPQGMASVMSIIMLLFMTIFYVLIPGALVLFYGRADVKATCAARDSQTRWTDRCPLPVLALSVIFGFWAVSLVSLGFYGWAIPFFGMILNGLPGAGLALATMALLVYATRGVYRLEMGAWWCGVMVIVGWALSALITFSRVSLLDFYAKMKFPQQTIDMMRQIGMPSDSTMAILFAVWVVVLLGYLVYVRRFFERPAPQA